jgi:peptide-methionine (S)-S-oxide reductase
MNLKRWIASLLVCFGLLGVVQFVAYGAPLAKATFAGGCFWCMEKPFDVLAGVVSTTSGYTGGQTVNPSYRQVSSGKTGHAESVQVVYDPAQVSYEKLLDVFWHNVDPLDAGGQFCDRGTQYRSSVFVYDDQQRKLAQESKQALEQSGIQPIATAIVLAGEFYPAEDYHQNYYETNALKYRFYRFACGRDQRLVDVWGEQGAVVSQPVTMPGG